MGKAANKTNEDTEAGSSQQIETKDITLAAALEFMETVSVQLDGISSAMKGTVSNCKKVDTSGKSTAAESDMSVDFQDIVRKFLNLKQTTTVQEYQEKFEEMRGLLMTLKFGLPEGFLISSFLSGLKPEVKRTMEDHKPETLYHAFNLARIKEIEIDLIIEDNLRRLDLVRELNLPSKYVEVNVGADNPLKFEAFVGGRAISVLIATGLDCSFIDTSLVKHVGSKLVEAEPLRVVFRFLCHLAASRFRYPKLLWNVEDHELAADVRVVDIKAYGMILGVDWVASIGNRLTFSKDGIMFQKDGKDVLLKTDGWGK